MQCSAWRPTSSASTSVRPASSSTRWNSCGPSPSLHAGPDRRVRVHPLGRRGARQQLQHHLEVAPLRQHLLDPHQRDQDLRQRRAHAPVALGLHDGDRAGLGDAEVRPADGDGHREELRAQVPARGLGDRARLQPELLPLRDRALEQRRDLRPVAVDRGDEDVRRLVVAELHDQLGEVGLDRRDPTPLERVVEADLVGRERLDLDHLARAVVARDARDDRVRLGRRRAPSAPFPPARVTLASSRSSCSGSVAIARALIAAPASRSASQSSSSATAAARLARIALVALPRLRRSCASASAVASRGREAHAGRAADITVPHDADRAARRGATCRARSASPRTPGARRAPC